MEREKAEDLGLVIMTYKTYNTVHLESASAAVLFAYMHYITIGSNS